MKLRYGDGSLTFTPAEQLQWQILDKEFSDASEDQQEIIRRAVISLADALESRIGLSAKLLLIVPDHTRKCQIHLILPLLINVLEERFRAQIQILIANGSHILQPDDVIRDLIGPEIFRQYPVAQHDCHDSDSLVYFGDTSYGTPVFLNEKVKQADFVLTIGGVLYHYFAGFGGGAKMLLPGVAGYETIRINHRRTIDERTGQFHPNCYEGNIETNPVFVDLAEVVNFVPNALSLQVALNPLGQIVKAEAGPILPTHKNICAIVKDMYSLPIGQKADVVVASAGGFPSDVNLIQAHKSIHHAFQAVNRNGYVIVLAECREGIGSKTFMPYFDAGTSEEIGKQLLADYKINGHTALALKRKTEEAKIILVSALDRELVRKTGMIPVKSVDEAWSLVAPNVKQGSIGYILPNAQLFVPMMEH